MTVASDVELRIQNLSVWKREGERAPHKPLLLLLSLARVSQGKSRLASFSELEEPLRHLLLHYGPPRKAVHPEYPFCWLRTDGLWVAPGIENLPRRAGSGDPLKSALIKEDINGGFPDPVFQLFRVDPGVLRSTAKTLLDAHFPISIHNDILNEIGLSIESQKTFGQRDADFRREVLRAYEHSCAICGYDAKVGSNDLGLEAAHIKWHQAGGPDKVQNGLALCTLHHKAFDLGAIGLNENRIIMISADVHGHNQTRKLFYAFSRKNLRRPNRIECVPDKRFILWHCKEVFRKPARD
jgi:putative restriction endonuclease